jgi:hypothetical protein
MVNDEPESVEVRLDQALQLLEACEAIVRLYQEQNGGQGDLLRKLQKVLD